MYKMANDVYSRRWVPEEDMEITLEAVRNGHVSLNATSCEYSAPNAVLKRNLHGKIPFAVGTLKWLVAWEVMLHILKRIWLTVFYNWNNF
jgi:hypothetical protein